MIFCPLARFTARHGMGLRVSDFCSANQDSDRKDGGLALVGRVDSALRTLKEVGQISRLKSADRIRQYVNRDARGRFYLFIFHPCIYSVASL
jgi:hypothetical protein